MNETATRQILWNLTSPLNVIAMYSIMVVALIVGAAGVLRRLELWSSGKDDAGRELTLPVIILQMRRFFDLYDWGFLQKGVVRERSAGIFHSLIYIGFLALLFTTTMVFIDNDLGIHIYRGQFYLGVTFVSDVLGIGVLFGCMIASHRRYVLEIDKLHNKSSDSILLTFLSLLIVQGFVLEGLRIHATNDPWALWSPVGLLFSKFFWALTVDAASLLHFGVWWFHTLTVFAVAAIFPYTKFFHIFSSSLNLYFRSSRRQKGEIKFPGDLEKMMESGEEFSLGLATIKDYSWKQLLDLDACTSCGRCQDVCPAYLTEKPLSPKWLILDTRNHALALHADNKLVESRLPVPLRTLDSNFIKRFLASSGVHPREEAPGYQANGSYRADNPRVQGSVRVIGASADDRISGAVMDPEVFWSCTTCMACVEACPVGINHVEQIIDNRRNMVLMQGEIPQEAQATLRALENRGNPYGPPQDRSKWMEGLDVPVIEAGGSVDYLYWVGCVSAYDPRKQKIARSLVTLMKKAGLSFGVLGNAEGCSGDPARRLGEENLFQTLAKGNIETLKSIRFKVLVANCPHCFNTIKNEYPQFGNLGEGRSPEIIHHSQLLRQLVKDGKLTLKEGHQNFTFHDPCYLGRYNEEYEAPREALGGVKGLKILEMEKSKNKGMCCGAGGGHFWMDRKIGERVNVLRTEHAAATGAENIATACPFCMQMMEDGVKLKNLEGSMGVKDIAEVLVEHLCEKHSEASVNNHNSH